MGFNRCFVSPPPQTPFLDLAHCTLEQLILFLPFGRNPASCGTRMSLIAEDVKCMCVCVLYGCACCVQVCTAVLCACARVHVRATMPNIYLHGRHGDGTTGTYATC